MSKQVYMTSYQATNSLSMSPFSPVAVRKETKPSHVLYLSNSETCSRHLRNLALKLSVSFLITGECPYRDANLLTLTFYSGYYVSGKALESGAGNISVTAPAAPASALTSRGEKLKLSSEMLGFRPDRGAAPTVTVWQLSPDTGSVYATVIITIRVEQNEKEVFIIHSLFLGKISCEQHSGGQRSPFSCKERMPSLVWDVRKPTAVRRKTFRASSVCMHTCRAFSTSQLPDWWVVRTRKQKLQFGQVSQNRTPAYERNVIRFCVSNQEFSQQTSTAACPSIVVDHVHPFRTTVYPCILPAGWRTNHKSQMIFSWFVMWFNGRFFMSNATIF